jgi:two-component system, NarL family, response regulator YdfI
LKDTDREALFDTIRAITRGETLLRPKIMTQILSKAGTASAHEVVLVSARGAETTSPLDLTACKREVLEAVAKGERSKEIALHMGITERTAKAHLASIYGKLGVDSRATAIAITARKDVLPR